ncbi:protein disulfide-isomerase TMX3-like [Sinocyclocheilus rhinocerous]|uniref:protein disulfide-isomerase TMX3-like n=1 Tax=Sinocyclocheilus rhinocerous TaxID=307959 RepID=UPI0007BA39B3|nr:PREDICTED: protein disulfide-isomerase TMX3-like [Sinocyclocheilus rhinocerous]
MRNVILTALLSVIAVVSGNVEELDDKFKDYLKHELWLVEFYAPWCAYCHTFEPIWHEVGAELKSMGSPVNVGKIDTTVHTSIASEFNIRGYPTIKLFKGELSFDYKGPRTKDAIIEFTNRVSGPVVRPLSSVQLFQHVMSRHDLIFVYIGRESLLKKEYYKAATEYIVHTYFFTASEEVLPKAVTLQDVPAVAVFKDRTYYLYNEFLDDDLSSWINRERFPSYFQIDSFSLYQMGELSKPVFLHKYYIFFTFFFYLPYFPIPFTVNKLSEVERPSIIVLNMTIDGYCLPESKIETIEDLLRFVNSVLDGSAKLLGGNGFLQHVKRSLYKAKSTVVSMFQAAPFFSCFVFGLPVGIVALVIWATCTAVPADDEKPVEGATASPVLDAHGKKAIELQPDSTEKTSEAKKED